MSRRLNVYIYAPVALLTLLAGTANAQSASLNGPIAGFVFNGTSKTVRPMLGIPGATRIDVPVLSRVEAASIAPGGKWAFITRARRSTFMHGLSDLAPTESSVSGLIDAVDRVVWSRDGSFAVLYSSSGNQFQRVQFPGSLPVADGPVDLSPWGQVTALAVDPAGQQIAVGFATQGLYLFTAGQSPALLSSMAQPVAAAFDGNGHSLFAVDLATQRIVQFQSTGGSADFVSLAQTDGPTLQPAGLAVSGDGHYLLLADSATRSVLVYATDSRSLANTLPLSFAPSRFEALSADPVFLLNGNDPKEWLLVLDARQVPVVYFVPASLPANSPATAEARQ
jgi:DNA-binding beta-propeller fold protein YncE